MQDLPVLLLGQNSPTDFLGGIDPKTLAASEGISQMATSEWLGPLAPIALSPFFGLTILSGVATYGPESLQQRSALFSDGSLLNSPLLFWCMLVLTVVTSLPRLTKVSKPLALAAENLETYSAVLILVAVRLFGSEAAPVEDSATVAAVPMLRAGMAAMPLDLALSAFAAINVVVINAVKLFFEFLVWLVPFPAVDAFLEVANKAACASLMALYAYSPTLATIFNLLLLTTCGLVFGWVYRRIRFYRQMIAGPLLAWLFPAWFAQRGNRFCAFLLEPAAGLPRFTPIRAVLPDGPQSVGGQMVISGRWLWRTLDVQVSRGDDGVQSGLVGCTLKTTDSVGHSYLLGHRKWVANDALYTGQDQLPQASTA